VLLLLLLVADYYDREGVIGSLGGSRGGERQDLFALADE
jgi:hypothetical protein